MLGFVTSLMGVPTQELANCPTVLSRTLYLRGNVLLYQYLGRHAKHLGSQKATLPPQIDGRYPIGPSPIWDSVVRSL